MTAHINIGSNLGDRAANIRRAVLLIAAQVGEITAKSTIIESSAWGYDSSQIFMNQGVNVCTDLGPREIVGRLQRIEQMIAPGGKHRDDSAQYIDREIDLDLICLDDCVSSVNEAIVPHPRMHLREFVLMPMVEILPQWQHPLLKLTPKQMLDAINSAGITLKKC